MLQVAVCVTRQLACGIIIALENLFKLYSLKTSVMSDQQRKVIVEELALLINKGNAHVSLDEAIADLPANLRTVIPDQLPYSIWQLLDHIRITQWDIIEFCLSGTHVSPEWPGGYWSVNPEKVSDQEWDGCLHAIRSDRERFFDLLKDDKTDLYSPLAHGDGQNIFREALLIADHTSYHLGEILVVRRLLKSWK